MMVDRSSFESNFYLMLPRLFKHSVVDL